MQRNNVSNKTSADYQPLTISDEYKGFYMECESDNVYYDDFRHMGKTVQRRKE